MRHGAAQYFTDGARRVSRPRAALTLVLAAAAVALLALVPQAHADTFAADDAHGLLLLSPAQHLQPVLPIGVSVTIVATPFTTVGTDQSVQFTLAGVNAGSLPGPVKRALVVTGFPNSGPKSARLTYTSNGHVGSDTITATYNDHGAAAIATTTIQWEKPVTTCAVGLPKLFQALGCKPAGKFVATIINTGGCLGAFTAGGKLAEAIRTAGVLTASERANSIYKLAHDLRALHSTDITVGKLARTASDANSVKGLITSLWQLMKQADSSERGRRQLGEIAGDLVDLAGFGPCVNLIRGSVAAPLPPTHLSCSLPNGAEGGGALPFSATGISCSAAEPIINPIVHDAGPCLVSTTGRRTDGFVCRLPGERYVAPGDKLECTGGERRIQAVLPG